MFPPSVWKHQLSKHTELTSSAQLGGIVGRAILRSTPPSTDPAFDLEKRLHCLLSTGLKHTLHPINSTTNLHVLLTYQGHSCALIHHCGFSTTLSTNYSLGNMIRPENTLKGTRCYISFTVKCVPSAKLIFFLRYLALKVMNEAFC